MNSSSKLITNAHKKRRRRKKKKPPLAYLVELHTFYHRNQEKFPYFPRSDMINEIDKNGNLKELLIFYDT